ncbi:MAG: adenine nucleotide alpha hydrolase [Vicinamibacteria bacterium]|nr:adenine nucleotide alpha hydrolase [Vicinamibacteria bacterium]
MSRTPILLAWSSGKDSAWALHTLRRSSDLEVVGLLTTVSSPYARVSMHAVRFDVLEAQADAVGLPLLPVEIPAPCSGDEYEKAMSRSMERARAEGVAGVAFGDLHLADVKTYRERQLARVDLLAFFPLWGRAPRALAEEMIASGLRAWITCVDPRVMTRADAGAAFDRNFLDRMHGDVDYCGENGEFHTFVWDGPMFRRSVPVARGPVVERDGFVFADLLLAGTRRLERVS